MKTQIFFLTKLSDWSSDRNHIVIRYNKQDIVSEPLAYISLKNRYKLCKLFKLGFWDSIKFIANYYSERPIYRHYSLLWESEDITDVIPFLRLLYKEIPYDPRNGTEKETLLDFLAKNL